MGDRCFMTLTCLNKDRRVFEEMGFGDEFGDAAQAAGSSKVELVDHEANYAHYGELLSLKGAGIPFTAQNGEGDGYGPSRYACAGKKVAFIESTHAGELYATMDDKTGKVQKGDVEAATRFLMVERRARKLLCIL